MNRSALKYKQALAKGHHYGENTRKHQLFVFHYKQFFSNASTTKESGSTALCKRNFLSKILDQKTLDKTNVSDSFELDKSTFVSALKTNVIFLNGGLEKKLSNYLNKKVSLLKVCTYLSLANRFTLTSDITKILKFIERCFQMVVETESFSQLDFKELTEILSSCELKIDSELEVFNAADAWVSCDSGQRMKFAGRLLSKVRLDLLSKHALEYILHRPNTWLNSTACCAAKIRNHLEKKEKSAPVERAGRSKNRYCTQSAFKTLVFGGYDEEKDLETKDVRELDFETLKAVKMHPAMIDERYYFCAARVKQHVYVMCDESKHLSVHRYSLATSKWEEAWTELHDGRNLRFTACPFMDSVFAVGCVEQESEGSERSGERCFRGAACLELSTRERRWRKIASMREKRFEAACAVFQGRVVVSGGCCGLIDSKTVEAYDHVADEWFEMPSMNEGRQRHCSVATRNKLFVVGGALGLSIEMFDSFSDKFVAFKRTMLLRQPFFGVQAHVCGRKIRVFGNGTHSMACYDIDKDEWSEEHCDVTKKIHEFRCVYSPVF